jgi:hypothetical protein
LRALRARSYLTRPQVSSGVSWQQSLGAVSDTRLTLVLAALTILCGMALYRLIGPVAGSGTVVALIALFNTHRLRRARLRQELLAELRAQASIAHAASLDAVSDKALRAQLAKDLAQEGAVEYQGDLARFHFPASFQRWATRRYWSGWVLGTSALLVSALSPTLSASWRSIWLVIGVICTVRVWRASHRQAALSTILEVTPYSVSEVWPNGVRRTVALGSHAVLAATTNGDLALLNTATGVGISVSTHRLGFHELKTLLTSRIAAGGGVAAS